MALEIPQSFSNDIQGKETFLTPMVIIKGENSTEDINISSSDFSYGARHFNPILVNVSTIKDNLDIDAKKYKVSNVTVTLSNFSYEGERFSRLYKEGDETLINTKVQVLWKSPTSEYIADESADMWEDTDNQLYSKCLIVFEGYIFNYEHDDDKIKIVIEDRSQSLLDIKLPNQYLSGADSPIPEESSNDHQSIL